MLIVRTPMNPLKSQKSRISTVYPELQRLAKKQAKKRAAGRKILIPLGTESLPTCKTFTVALVSSETIQAGFPFGIRINVEAHHATQAVGVASDQLRNLVSSVRAKAQADLAGSLGVFLRTA